LEKNQAQQLDVRVAKNLLSLNSLRKKEKKENIKEGNMKIQQCNCCHKRYKVLTPEGLCYFCFKNKYGIVPTKGCYEEGKIQK
jgi:hypothetical protein